MSGLLPKKTEKFQIQKLELLWPIYQPPTPGEFIRSRNLVKKYLFHRSSKFLRISSLDFTVYPATCLFYCVSCRPIPLCLYRVSHRSIASRFHRAPHSCIPCITLLYITCSIVYLIGSLAARFHPVFCQLNRVYTQWNQAVRYMIGLSSEIHDFRWQSHHLRLAEARQLQNNGDL